MHEAACPLCDKIQFAREKHGADLVWEFPESIVFLGPWQFYEGYCVVTAKRHVTELYDLNEAQRHAVMDEVSKMAQAIAAVVKPRKINYEFLGNQVPHMHWHLFPRQQSDPKHLQAAWIDIGEAEKDPKKKEQWQRSAKGKQAIIHALQQALQHQR